MKHIKLAITDLQDDYHAVKILDMTGIERGCGDCFVARNGVMIRSHEYPEFNVTGSNLKTLYLWGAKSDLDSRPLLVASEYIPDIEKAVQEFNEKHAKEPNYKNGGLEARYKIIDAKTNKEVDGTNCFVLNYEKDPHACKAMLVYTDSVKSENPQLASDIEARIMELYPSVTISEIREILREFTGR